MHPLVEDAPSMRERVTSLQAVMMDMPQVELPTQHTFHGGLYVREVFRPAGTLIVGNVHKKDHVYYIVFGTVVVTTDEGVQEITGPAIVKSTPGTKRAVMAVTDALCMTIHRTDAQTPEEAEPELIEPDTLSLFDAQNKVKTPSLDKVNV